MTRSSIWIGVVSFVLAMLMTFSIDLGSRNVALSSISLGGLPAFAKDRRGPRIELPSALEALSDLSEAAEAADDGDEGDDDEGPDDDGGDDN